jgi:hypothetical protein
MRRLALSRFRVLAVVAAGLAAGLGAASLSAAQVSSVDGSTSAGVAVRSGAALPDEVTAATAFLLAVYPDLTDEPLSLAVKREAGKVLVSVRPATVASEPGADGVRPPPVLGAVFAFTASGDLQSFVAQGTLVEAREMRSFVKLSRAIRPGPVWTRKSRSCRWEAAPPPESRH